MRRVGIAAVVVSAWLAACGGDEDPSAESEAEAGDAEDTEGALPELPRPDFIEPASGTVEITTARHDDLRLRVGGVTPGATMVLIDGGNVGTLVSPSAIGVLDHEHLVFHLEGAMLPGTHRVRLSTPGLEEPSSSKEITVRIVAAPPPTLEATLASTEVWYGDRLAAQGTDEHGLLLVVDDATEKAPVLTVARASGEGWDTDDVRSVSLPGLVVGLDPRPAVGAWLEESDDDVRLLVAWRVGTPGERIDVVDVGWDTGEPGEPRPVLTSEPPLVGHVEYASWGVPSMLGRTLMAEIHQAVDVESPRPGDHTLAFVRLRGTPSEPGLRKRVGFGTTQDLDATGPTIDLLAARWDGVRSMSVRRNRSIADIVDVSDTSGLPRLRPGAPKAHASFGATFTGGLVTLVGAFGGRTIAGLVENRVEVWEHDPVRNELREVSPQADALPEAPPSGPLGATIVGGHVVLFVPYGPAEPVRAVITGSTPATVVPLEALRCDAVAAPATTAGNTAGAVQVACLRDRAVRIGTVRALP